MSEASGTQVDDAAGAGDAVHLSRGSRRWPLGLTDMDMLEVALAVAAFIVLCVVILRTAPQMPEPDDYAYQGSIVAMTDGHFLSLSTAQMDQLARQVHGPGGPFGPGGSVPQWVRLASGRWISEKDPGFPFLAFAFQWLGIIRADQLFYGAIACLGLFAGARRWLGRFGGAAAAGLYCSSGAAMLWGWRDYMPTFTDASLIAAGTGALLWSVLAAEAGRRLRLVVGLLGFVALELATFTRYTDVVVLGCAVIAVLALRFVRPAQLPREAIWWWLGSVAAAGAGIAVFDDLVYGGPLKSGYQPGEIQFSLAAIVPNLRYMPAHLMQAMPVLVLALAALGWIVVRRARSRRSAEAGRDLAVGAALFACWLAMWGLYSAYTWTTAPGASTLQVARFYVPALGAIALLGAFLVTKLPWRIPELTAAGTAAVVVVMFAIGIGDFHAMLSGGPIGRFVHVCPGVVREGVGKPPPKGTIRCPVPVRGPVIKQGSVSSGQR
ncbi:MAG TPA: hypothetical protein VMA95_19590 [Streptosporangiaceae bacterium]|nr:hypothetical protein [Streptosporangiaceae bacterium]